MEPNIIEMKRQFRRQGSDSLTWEHSFFYAWKGGRWATRCLIRDTCYLIRVIHSTKWVTRTPKRDTRPQNLNYSVVAPSSRHLSNQRGLELTRFLWNRTFMHRNGSFARKNGPFTPPNGSLERPNGSLATEVRHSSQNYLKFYVVLAVRRASTQLASHHFIKNRKIATHRTTRLKIKVTRSYTSDFRFLRSVIRWIHSHPVLFSIYPI